MINYPLGSGGKRTYAIPRWRFYDLLHILGTVPELQAKLRARGYPAPPRETIQGWRNRNSIPANWVPVFLQIALEEQVVPNIASLRKEEAKPRAKRKPRENPNGPASSNPA